MQLKDYRAEKRLTLEDIAAMMSFNAASTVHRHETGARIPNLDQIERYRKVTGNAVTVDDWNKLRAAAQRRKAAA